MTLTSTELIERLSEVLEAAASADSPESFFMRRLEQHFGEVPIKLPLITEEYGLYQHPCIQLALDHYLAQPGRVVELLGVAAAQHRMSFMEILASANSDSQAIEGPVQYRTVELANDNSMSCVERGLYLISSGKDRIAFLLSARTMAYEEGVEMEVLASERAFGEQFLAEIKALANEHSVYRNHILTVSARHDNLSVSFHKLSPVAKTSLILPREILQRIEKHAMQFSQHSEMLRAAGMHLKRGILLHGVPGTGKSLTLKYLIGEMNQRTTFLVYGPGISGIKAVFDLAASLQPATVIIEDVDLIGEERSKNPHNQLLFELLNAMDGLNDDVDILCLLTTNRPEMLEPALAARPGRIDQAILIPLPDDDCRRRLFALYAGGLTLEVKDIDKYVGKTKGASAAFIRELLRKAALTALQETNQLTVTDLHLDDALKDLVMSGALTKSILGFSPGTSSSSKN
jgi:ATPase family associated with various cellular activities (AAA)